MRNPRLVAFGLAGAALLVCAGAAWPTPVGDAAGRVVSGVTLVTDDVGTRQVKLHHVGDAVQELVDRQVPGSDGYSGIVMDPAARALDLYWKGGVPAQVARVIAERTPDQYAVRVHSAPYSRAELLRAVDALARAAGPGEWSSIFPLEQGTGLRVGYQVATTHRIAGSSPTPDSYAAGATALSGGVPVTAVPEGGFTDLAGPRGAARSPWDAGAELRSPAGSFCSSGFAGFSGNRRVLLTAGHCGAQGTYRTGDGQLVGDAVQSDAGLDITAVGLGQGAEGRFYDGSWSSASTRGLYGAGRNDTGDLVCTSGAMSGYHCDVQVTATDGKMRNEHGDVIGPVDLAEHRGGHDVVVAQGDSGGPVIANPSGPQAAMSARGILIAGGSGTQLPCHDTAVATTCFWQAVYVPMTPIVNAFNFSTS
ncbi:hypothetical protein [Kitasatospora viridis]|uniref:Streptogrisin C n=1 Tax=Kitasatospora viridis TaxID=281105 RepID=A0A561SG48_9ACTN|nr:hypothetical protein [Kitasatospora viridis]TWF73842.1 hypothetical protein FHX73_15469 [Kitasatospora viridis]